MVRRLCAAFLAAWLATGWASAQEEPEDPNKPVQVTVSAKVIEFQATKGVETGLSAYFQRRARTDWFGVVKPPFQGLMTADITFPTSTAGGITVFLDRLRLTEGDIELVLQGLVDENRASILARPTVTIPVGSAVPSEIKITRRIPFENTTVVGATTVQTTDFHDTGVTMAIEAVDIVDGDGNWVTTGDTYIRMKINAEVSEEGQRLVVALDDQLAAGGNFAAAQNLIRAPEFVTRRIATEVWVRHGQILVLGGLYSSAKSKSLSTSPWLTQAEDIAVGVAERAVPGEFLVSPLSSTIGNRSTSDARRELVFFVKAEAWRPAYTLPETTGFTEVGPGQRSVERAGPADLITDVLGGIRSIPEGLGEEIKKKAGEGGIEKELGGKD